MGEMFGKLDRRLGGQGAAARRRLVHPAARHLGARGDRRRPALRPVLRPARHRQRDPPRLPAHRHRGDGDLHLHPVLAAALARAPGRALDRALPDADQGARGDRLPDGRHRHLARRGDRAARLSGRSPCRRGARPPGAGSGPPGLPPRAHRPAWSSRPSTRPATRRTVKRSSRRSRPLAARACSRA